MATEGLCAIPGCDKRGPLKRGWCNAHYLRWIRRGDPTAGGPAKTQSGALPAYLESVVLPFTGDGCLIWPFGRTGSGYAAMRGGDAQKLVHRLVCERVHGPPPTPEHEAAHSCGQGHKGCVAPAHLAWKTGAENQADRLAHGTKIRGADHPLAKLTEDDVRNIRAAFGRETLTSLAARYGVSKQNINAIVRRKTWRWVT